MARSSTTARRRLVSINQAAEYAGVSTKTIRRRISDGTLNGYLVPVAPPKRPRLIRVDLNELDAKLKPVPSAAS